MNLYEACATLGVWHVVKARAEVWSVSPGDHTTTLDELKSMIKDKFRELAMKLHPDKGGDNDGWVKIQEAHELIKSATVIGLVGALETEQLSGVKYHAPGSEVCNNCSKWSDIVQTCATASCTGFKERGTHVLLGKVQDWRKGKNPKNSGFFSGRGDGLERATG